MQSELKRRPLCCVRVAAVLLAVAIATPSAVAERRLDQIAQLDRSSSPTREPLPPIVGGVPFLIRFAGSVRGLQPGSPVEVQGIRIGNVLSVDVEYAAEKNNFVVPVKRAAAQPVSRRRAASTQRGGDLCGGRRAGAARVARSVIRHAIPRRRHRRHASLQARRPARDPRPHRADPGTAAQPDAQRHDRREAAAAH
jgi:MlaD protein